MAISSEAAKDFSSRGIRARQAGRRHHAGAHFADHLLHLFGALLDVREIDLRPGEPAGFQLVVMAAEAVLIHQILI